MALHLDVKTQSISLYPCKCTNAPMREEKLPWMRLSRGMNSEANNDGSIMRKPLNFENPWVLGIRVQISGMTKHLFVRRDWLNCSLARVPTFSGAVPCFSTHSGPRQTDRHSRENSHSAPRSSNARPLASKRILRVLTEPQLTRPCIQTTHPLDTCTLYHYHQ